MEAPVILKGGPITRTQNNPKAPREGRPHREDPNKSTKVPSKAVLKKSTKELEDHGGPWLEAFIVVCNHPPKEAPKSVLEAPSEGGPQERLGPHGVPKVPPMLHPTALQWSEWTERALLKKDNETL